MTTCSTLDALYAAILENPHEDTPRLAYADELDEQGDTSGRAEFIRVQCELAKFPPTVPWDTFTSSAKAEFVAVREDDPRREKLERREQELLNAHDWDGEFTPLSGMTPIFRRGFVDEVTVPDATPHRRPSPPAPALGCHAPHLRRCDWPRGRRMGSGGRRGPACEVDVC